ncbi:MAG: hypothetical protein ACRDE5_05705 [Ginsengibacter sp.]
MSTYFRTRDMSRLRTMGPAAVLVFMFVQPTTLPHPIAIGLKNYS